MQKEKINLCLYCKNRKRDFKIGIICSFDNKKHTKWVCEKFAEDPNKKKELVRRRTQAENKKLQVKIFGGIVGILVLVFVIFLVQKKIERKNYFVDKSIEIAQIIQNDRSGMMQVKLKDRLFLERLTLPGHSSRRVIADREGPALECLKDFFELYKVPMGYISYKNYYFDDDDKINLVFVVASPDRIIDIYEIKTGWVDNLVKIIDFFAYSRGQWESKIQSQYMEMTSNVWHPEPSSIERKFIKLDSLVNDTSYIKAIDLMKTLPDRFLRSGDVREGVLELAKRVSPEFFERKLDSVLTAPVAEEFIKIWKYRKAFLFHDKKLLQEMTQEIGEELNNDPIFKANSSYLEHFSEKAEAEDVEKKLLSLVDENPKIDYIKYRLLEFYYEQIMFGKATKLEEELFDNQY